MLNNTCGVNDKMIILPIKKKWFKMIKAGEKKEEYREIRLYYNSRFTPFFKSYAPIHVRFRNGYSRQCPCVDVLCWVSIGEGFEKWGAQTGKKYYILHIEKVY